MVSNFFNRLLTLVAACVLSALSLQANATPFYQSQDTTPSSDTSRYPIYDRYGDYFTNPNRNAFDLRDTAFVDRNIEYDPLTRQYYVIEKVGDKYYRIPTTLTMEEYLRLRGRRDEVDYFRQRANLSRTLCMDAKATTRFKGKPVFVCKHPGAHQKEEITLVFLA